MLPYDLVNDHLGGLVLKEEQKLAVEALFSGKDVMAVLPTGFGKSIIYQSYLVAKNWQFHRPSWLLSRLEVLSKISYDSMTLVKGQLPWKKANSF